tara:strand:- start:1323 stop:1619 length:297 start_codon:yes stop_codon:yes gene_type:complete
MTISLPSYGQLTGKEKTAWTGGYLYGFSASLCESKRLGFITEREFYYLSNRIINFYRDKLATFAYSADSTSILYQLEDNEKLNQVCANVEKDLRTIPE